MTSEELSSAIKDLVVLINEDEDAERIEEEHIRKALTQNGLDERFWYILWLACPYMNDLESWAEEPDACLVPDTGGID